jgi:hypothetical protein
MIILNACKDVKLEFTDDVQRLLFSPRILKQKSLPVLCVIDDVLIEKKMDDFLSDKEYHWIRSEDRTQIYAVAVNAEEELCRKFLKDFLCVDGEVFLDDE